MRNAILAAAFLWLTPVMAVAAGGLGLPLVPALAIGAIAAAAMATVASGAVHRRIGVGGLPKVLALALALAAALAIVHFARMSVFIADANRTSYSIEPDDPFRRVHSCMSAYAESARFASEGGHNIYERSLYRQGENIGRPIGPLRVDPFHYPPPFLLAPHAVRVVAPDFWDFRRIWFALQALTLAGAIVGLAAWIGGRGGAFALLGGTLVLAFPHTAATLQQGNFQITAVPLAAVAFVLLSAGRHALGGSVLAYAALAKIFPGILVVPLIAGRQWRRTAWVAGAAVVLLALTVLVDGVAPFRDFVSTALPEISSGAAFPQTENPAHSRVNWSAYGQTVRLRHLGATWLTQPRGLMLMQLYGIVVVALAAWVGWKRRFDVSRESERLALLQVTLALIGLASFRSPFVGAVYGTISTLWLMGLIAAGASAVRTQITWFAALVAIAWTIWIMPSPAGPPSTAWIWISGVLLTATMLVNLWAIASAVKIRRRAREATPALIA
jgi:hypothetical protein